MIEFKWKRFVFHISLGSFFFLFFNDSSVSVQ